MAGRKLAVNVVLPAPPGDGGEAFRVYGPDSTDIPEWAADQIGDHCWVKDEPAVKTARK